jgi:L-ascorbate metabolism protein UlaG (beta-lactamase superfamily)
MKEKGKLMSATVTYLAHSGFLLETDKLICLFDYYTGKIPALNPQKPLYVFASHDHHDHYNSEIWKLRHSHPDTTYILSKDINLSAGQKTRLGLTAKDEERIYRLGADQTLALPPYISVRTLLSTDEGVAFIVESGEQTFFHAGDLNYWIWQGDPEATNRDRQCRFMNEMNKIDGMVFDLAFFPLDPRQGDDCGAGFHIFQQMTKAKKLFPMHLWGKYETVNTYLNKFSDTAENIVVIQYEGQVFEV